MTRLPKSFRWDLFIRDFNAYVYKRVETNGELAHKWGINYNTFSAICSGRVQRVSVETMEKILKGMSPHLYIDFYCE